MASRILVIVSFVATLISLPALAVTYHIPDQYPTIQLGIYAASSGDTVLVACGTYYEHDIVMKSRVCLRSEAGDPTCVTVDALHQGVGIYCSDVNPATTIEGLTITRSVGAGMYMNWGSPTVM